MILRASVPQNTLYLAGCDRILAILTMGVDEFFVHSRVQTLKSTLKPFWGLLLPSNPLKNIGFDNETTC